MPDAVTSSSGTTRPHPRRRIALAVLAALFVWVGIDLYGPFRTDIRVFDADEVARLDTVMWHSYYDKKPLTMYFQLAELLRRQFHFPLLRSHLVAADAAKAAFVFKRGKGRADYLRALPDLVDYFAALRRVSTTPFDVQRTAELELEWWIVHRERARHRPGDLARALAEGAAVMYQVPARALMPYGRERDAAMVIRDTKAASGGVTDADWERIERHLQTSWRSLSEAVRPR